MGWNPSTHRDGPRAAGRRPAGAARRWARAATLGGGALVLAGCSSDSDNELGRLGYPKSASDRGEAIFDLWIGEWIAAGIIGIGVFALIMWSVLRYRRTDDAYIPPQVRYNLPIEILYTLAPVIIIAALFFHTVQTQQTIDETSEEPDHVVKVIGQKWGWTFVYEGEDALGGDVDVFDTGTPEDIADLYLPIGETVRFELQSQDVIHSFWVPEFYYKLDVFPGENDNAFEMTPTRLGDFRGRCAELCGTYHSRMLFDLHIVTAEEFEAHLADLEESDQVGSPPISTETTEIQGLEQEEDE